MLFPCVIRSIHYRYNHTFCTWLVDANFGRLLFLAIVLVLSLCTYCWGTWSRSCWPIVSQPRECTCWLGVGIPFGLHRTLRLVLWIYYCRCSPYSCLVLRTRSYWLPVPPQVPRFRLIRVGFFLLLSFTKVVWCLCPWCWYDARGRLVCIIFYPNPSLYKCGPITISSFITFNGAYSC